MSGANSVTILWGETPDDGDAAVTYTFETAAALHAFKLGVAEAQGWAGWREVPHGYVYRNGDEID